MDIRPRILIVALALALLPCFAVAPRASAAPEDYGIFPNAAPGSYCTESHTWWTEGENADPNASARHIHVGVCLPAMRGPNDTSHPLSGTISYVARVVTFRVAQVPDWVGVSFFSDSGQSAEPRVTNLAQYEVASATPGERVYLVPVSIAATAAKNGGGVELRTRANIDEYDDLHTRHFTTNNMQVYLANGKGGDGYRNLAEPIGRGWYEGLDYAVATLYNWGALCGGNADDPEPIVHGTIGLTAKVDSLSGTTKHPKGGAIVIDPDYHHGAQGTTLCTLANGSKKTCQLDTRALANGVHDIFINADEADSRGQHRGQLRVRVNVQNP